MISARTFLRVPGFESWQKSSSPAMSVMCSDAQGNPIQEFIRFYAPPFGGNIYARPNFHTS